MRMKRSGRLLAAAVLLTLLPGYHLTPAGASETGTGPTGAGPTGAPTSPARTVTLITGDRVTAIGRNLTVRPAPGREKARFLIRHVDGEQHVIPVDAFPLLQSGRLDPRLFSISALLDANLDRATAGLPLILTRANLTTAGRATASPPAVERIPGLTGTRPLRAAKAVAATAAPGGELWRTLTATGARRNAAAGDTRIWLDGVHKLQLATSVPLVGAPAAWQAGYDGTGVKVAILDTGIDLTHPDLVGKVVLKRNFIEANFNDLSGHGTHIASTVAGSGAASGGRNRGVASGAQLLDGRICDGQLGCTESLILEGMQWAVDNGAKVVNMSFGSPDTPGVDPIEQAVNDLTAQYGVLFVAAAGNFGATPSVRIGRPATAEAALAVGATTRADQAAWFSSWGFDADNRLIKPEIVAPGEDIVAARSIGSGQVRPVDYISFSGTSMATPHVVGAAAILAQQHPDWDPATLKSALMGSAKPLPITARQVGAGRLDVARAIGQTVVTEPASVNFGQHLWPHNKPAVPRPVTYTNRSTQPVTLTLSTAATGPKGEPVPVAGFRAEPATVTIPAGGQAEVNLLADSAAIGAVYGLITGHLIASTGGSRTNTVFTLDNEEESYDLHLLHIGRDGAPALGYHDTIKRLDKPGFTWTSGPNGSTRARLPKGSYTVYSTTGPDPDTLDTMMIHPRLAVSGTDTLVVDARGAKPVSITPPRSGLNWLNGLIGAQYDLDGNQSSIQLYSEDPNQAYLGRIGRDQSVNGLRTWIRGTLYEPGPTGTDFDSPAVYHLAWHEERRITNGFTRVVRQRDLATIQYDRGGNGSGGIMFSGTFALPTRSDWGVISPSLMTSLPLRRTEYVTTEDGARWYLSASVFGADFSLITEQLSGNPFRYLAGRRYVERWNHAVYSQTFPRDQFLPTEAVARRVGNDMVFHPAFNGDSEGRHGGTPVEWLRTALFRNGVLLHPRRPFPVTEFAVPAEPADYRIEIVQQRPEDGSGGELSTMVRTDWSFRSGHSGETPVLLPVWAVRFTPPVDIAGSVPAGQTIRFPVIPESQPGSATGNLSQLTVQVSFDDGQTWQDTPVKGTGSGRTISVTHPASDGFVSLRSTLIDSLGNKLEQTIIRAYRYTAQP